jgi:hypothetical protein
VPNGDASDAGGGTLLNPSPALIYDPQLAHIKQGGDVAEPACPARTD